MPEHSTVLPLCSTIYKPFLLGITYWDITTHRAKYMEPMNLQHADRSKPGLLYLLIFVLPLHTLPFLLFLV